MLLIPLETKLSSLLNQRIQSISRSPQEIAFLRMYILLKEAQAKTLLQANLNLEPEIILITLR